MTSWRERASSQAQEDLDGLLSAALEIAQQALVGRGQLAPFGVATDTEGQGLLVAADPAELSADPTAVDIRLQVLTQLIVGAGSLRAGGVVVDVDLDGQDAVRVELEHREGAAVIVLAPYRRGNGGVEFGELQGAAGSRTIWVG